MLKKQITLTSTNKRGNLQPNFSHLSIHCRVLNPHVMGKLPPTTQESFAMDNFNCQGKSKENSTDNNSASTIPFWSGVQNTGQYFDSGSTMMKR